MAIANENTSHHVEAASSTPADIVNYTQWKPEKGQRFIFGCLSLLSFIIALDTTIVTPAIPVLQNSLHGDLVKVFWTGTSYLLASAVYQPFIVDLSDVFGRRIILALVTSLFTLGTILCSVSHDFNLFLAGRGLQGLGAGGIMATCIVITTDIVPLRQRPTYYAIIQMAWAAGSLAGPVVGGAIAQSTSWRWIFYINLPFCGIGLRLVPLTVHLKAERPSIMQRLVSIDWISGVVFIGSLCSFLIGISWGGNQFAWYSWRTIVPIGVGGVGVIVAILWEAFFATRPFIHVSLFANYSALIAYVCTLLQGAIMALLYFIPLFMQIVKGFDAVGSGLALMVVLGVMLPGSMAAGIMMTRLVRHHWAVWTGWTCSILATGSMTLLKQHTSASRWVFIFLTLGVGQGLSLTSLNFAVQALARDNRDTSAAGMYTFMRTLGMCIAVATGGTFFENRAAYQLGQDNLLVSVAKAAAQFALELREPGFSSALKTRYILAFTEAFKQLWFFFMAISALALVLSLFIHHSSLDRTLESEHTLINSAQSADE
ncbi:MFS general substrate transporter [Aspergillus sclerotioniger CBS 115572]|uniref:MFS general substrate transporter n=1 Tax=Aspergillus sclerotioniger CBS 115572 TaxID=1450535 RepID=A0A317W488_9EURO|nr:MFS general substrate transporter [Aspergillus sclerotioniger CBS 115572]PWY80789.1 MFS general substrate transporter [Aspergillus sclerotioniger CBS 115572]